MYVPAPDAKASKKYDYRNKNIYMKYGAMGYGNPSLYVDQTKRKTR